ncbi:MAG TPA: phosphatase PAP2 family protein [Micromonosporaceae bacterium]
MTFRGLVLDRTVPTDRRPPLWRELVVGLAVFAVYSVVAGLDWAGRTAGADHHGRGLFALERVLRLDVERPLNSWLSARPVLRVLANYEYATTYVISAFALLGWLWLHRPEVYRWARTSFILVNLVSFGCFAMYPVTPPRLLGDLGFVDTVRLGHTWGSWGSPGVDHANQLAAMPSLHVAWALWVSVVLAVISSGRVVQVAGAAHVLITVLVIMATANHYLVDAIAAIPLVWLGVRLSGPLPTRSEAV